MSDKRTTLDEAVSSIGERHDHRHRWLGIAAQADGVRARPVCAPTSPTSPSSATAGRTSGCCARRARSSASYYGFVSLDSPPFYDPWFAKARTSGAIEAREMDEGMLRCGLQAAAQRLPFLPIRAGLGSDVRRVLGRRTEDGDVPRTRPTAGSRNSSRCQR